MTSFEKICDVSGCERDASQSSNREVTAGLELVLPPTPNGSQELADDALSCNTETKTKAKVNPNASADAEAEPDADADADATKLSSEGSSRRVTFNTVTVFYFQRSQGFSCVPSQGGSTLGMASSHEYRRVFTLSEFRREKLRERYELLKRHHETGRVRLAPEVLERVDRLLRKLRRTARRRRRLRLAQQLNVEATSNRVVRDLCNRLSASRKRSLAVASASNHSEREEGEDDLLCAKRTQLECPQDAAPNSNHSTEEQKDDTMQSGDSWFQAESESEEIDMNSDSASSCLLDSSASPSGSEDDEDSRGDEDSETEAEAEVDVDLDDDAIAYLCGPQPVSAKQRRSLLRTAGVRNIDPKERDECNAIRLSREQCGCSCQVYCEPTTCECARDAIRCQVDRVKFPCGCTREGCRNPQGRVEFNPLRVRAHFIHTVVRLRREAREQSPSICRSKRKSVVDDSESESDCDSVDNSSASVSDSQSTSSDREDEDSGFNSTESGSCRDCLGQPVGHPPSCNDVLLSFARTGSQSQTHSNNVNMHQQTFANQVSTTPTVTSNMFAAAAAAAAYSYHAHAALNNVAHTHVQQSVASGHVSHHHQFAAAGVYTATATPSLSVQHYSNGNGNSHLQSYLGDQCEASDSNDGSDDERSTATDEETASEEETCESESGCVDESQSDSEDDESCVNHAEADAQTASTQSRANVDSADRIMTSATPANDVDDLHVEREHQSTGAKSADRITADLNDVIDGSNGPSRANNDRILIQKNSGSTSSPPSPIFVSLCETSSILASAMVLPFSFDETQNDKDEKARQSTLNAHLNSSPISNTVTSVSTNTDINVDHLNTNMKNRSSAKPSLVQDQAQSPFTPFNLHSSVSRPSYFAPYYHAAASADNGGCCSSTSANLPLLDHRFTSYSHSSTSSIRNPIRGETNHTAACVSTSPATYGNSLVAPRNDVRMYIDYAAQAVRWPALAAYARPAHLFGAPSASYAPVSIVNGHYESTVGYAQPASLTCTLTHSAASLGARLPEYKHSPCSDASMRSATRLESSSRQNSMNESISDDGALGAGPDCLNSPVAVDTPSTLNESNSDATSTSSTLTFGEIIKESIVVDTVSAYG